MQESSTRTHDTAAWLPDRIEIDKRCRYFPAYDAHEIADCLRHLRPSEPQLEADHIATILSAHRFMAASKHIVARLILPLGLLSYALFIVFLPELLRTIPAAAEREPLTTALTGSELALVTGAAVWLTLRGHWHGDFFHSVARALKTSATRPDPVRRVARFTNSAGRSARFLFLDLQGQRFTWASPPTVADRTLTLSYPLINVDLDAKPDPRGLDTLIATYAEFLYFAAGLVAVDRADLIPSLRDYYATDRGMAYRPDSPVSGAVPERDALFLDPMRNHNRWTVAKDHLYPLASWIGLAVSIVALVTSLHK